MIRRCVDCRGWFRRKDVTREWIIAPGPIGPIKKHRCKRCLEQVDVDDKKEDCLSPIQRVQEAISSPPDTTEPTTHCRRCGVLFKRPKRFAALFSIMGSGIETVRTDFCWWCRDIADEAMSKLDKANEKYKEAVKGDSLVPEPMRWKMGGDDD